MISSVSNLISSHNVDIALSRLINDSFVDLYASSNDVFKLANYVWNKQLIPFNTIQEDIRSSLICYRKQHQKDKAKAETFVNFGDDCFYKKQFHKAIKNYTKALRLAPHDATVDKRFNLGKIYAKRAICFYMINLHCEAEYDYQCASHIDAYIGQICLQKAILNLKIKNNSNVEDENQLIQMIHFLQNKPLKKIEASNLTDSGIYFSPNILNLWFNNRARGSRHPTGAHYPCAKSDLPDDLIVLEEKPFIILSGDMDKHCPSCDKLIDLSFWPCPNCDEVVFCSIKCQLECAHHQSECGFVGFFRKNLTPLGTTLFQVYLKTKCKPEYSAKTDIIARPTLSTDADVYFVSKPNKNKLPKRSYQYRHFLLANSNCKKSLINSPANDLIPQEVLLALRESADNKDELLPQISKYELLSIILESVQLVYLIEFFQDKLDLNQTTEEKEDYVTQTKHRLLSIIEDFKRIYRLNIGQGYRVDNDDDNRLVFALPIVGTFFWPDCKPNVEVTYCSNSRTLVYRTLRKIQKFEKFTISFPRDYFTSNCFCLSCNNVD